MKEHFATCVAWGGGAMDWHWVYLCACGMDFASSFNLQRHIKEKNQ